MGIKQIISEAKHFLINIILTQIVLFFLLLFFLLSNNFKLSSIPVNLTISTLIVINLFYIWAMIFFIFNFSKSSFRNYKTVLFILFKIFLPVNLLIRELFHYVSREVIVREFLIINNEIVKKTNRVNKLCNLLILLPHCLQNSDCKIRITYNIDNCIHCGKCDICKLCKLKEKYSLKIFIASGGTIARKIIKENKPELIIAVACERDMLSGVRDVFPIPVYSVLNDRPEGPCFNTRVSVEKIENFIKNRDSNTEVS
ncbi:MAG: DUF116 domain-containing protein [Candidatus Cloacimonetes bacterium]|nr:DUF116 domain-containing protein [Candidatus Cloacimonadota bacterium]